MQWVKKSEDNNQEEHPSEKKKNPRQKKEKSEYVKKEDFVEESQKEKKPKKSSSNFVKKPKKYREEVEKFVAKKVEVDVWNNYKMKNWKRLITITLTTEIPPLPTEILKEPSWDEVKKKQNALEDKIDEIRKALRDFNESLYAKRQDTKNNKSEEERSLKNLKKEKLLEKDKIFDEKKIVLEKLRLAQKICKNYRDQLNKIKERVLVKKQRKDLEEDLEDVENKLNNAKLTLIEEKQLVRQKDNIVQSIPHVDLYFELKNNLEEALDNKNDIQEQLDKLNKRGEQLREEIKDLIDKIFEIREKKKGEKEVRKTVIPENVEKKKQFKQQIDKLYDEIDDLEDKYDKDLLDYDIQQSYIERVNWATEVKKKKEKYEKDKEKRAKYAKLAEERRKKEEEEEKKSVSHPYQKQIDTCHELIGYLKNLKTANQSKTSLAEAKDIEANYNKFVGDQGLKKEKLVAVIPKRAQEICNPALENKKKKKEAMKKKKTPVKQEEANEIIHHPELLRTFDSIKVQPPNTILDVEAILQLVKDKASYFESLPSNPSSNQVQSENTKEDSKHHHDKHERRHRVEPINENDFPSFKIQQIQVHVSFYIAV